MPDMKKCPKCNVEYPRDSYPGKKKKSGWCKGCCAVHSREYYQKNKEKSIKAHKEWVNKNRDRVAYHRVKSAYGITKDEYKKLDKKCFICGKTENLRIDHSHYFGRIRGVLCDLCNKGLGFFKDNPTLLYRAGDYILEKAPKLKDIDN